MRTAAAPSIHGLAFTVLAVLVSACHHAPPPAPPAPAVDALGAPCPDAVPISPQEAHPVRVEVVNETGQAMRVVLDRCRWWTRLGSVAPGRTAYLRLPDRLLRFGDGLRFHAFTESPNQWYGAFASDFQIPIAHLVVSPGTALMNAPRPDEPVEASADTTAVSARPATGTAVSSRGPTSAVVEGPDRVSLFSFDSFAVLTWRCTEAGEPELAFASGQHLSGDVDVTLSLDGEDRAFGTWSLVRAFTDGALAPGSQVQPFTAAVRGARAVAFLAGTGGRSPERYNFSTRELDSAVAGLSCLR